MSLASALTLSVFAVCATLAACSPYVFSDDTKAFSNAMSSMDQSYKDNLQGIETEEQQANRLKWMRDRPQLRRGPGCASTTRDPTPCSIYRVGETQKKTVPPSTPTATRAKASENVCKSDVQIEYVDVEKKTKTLTKLERADLMKAVDAYIAALAAISKAQDRADFDSAAGKVSAAVGGLAQSAAAITPAAVGAGAIGGVAKASTNALLWIVGQSLDYQRLQQLRLSTEAACERIHILSSAIGAILDEERGDRLDGLHEIVELRIQSANRLAPRATDQVYGTAVDDAFGAASAYQAVRITNPQKMAQALRKTHDALVVAIRNNDGELAALVESLKKFGQLTSDLMTASSASAQSSTPAKSKATTK